MLRVEKETISSTTRQPSSSRLFRRVSIWVGKHQGFGARRPVIPPRPEACHAGQDNLCCLDEDFEDCLPLDFARFHLLFPSGCIEAQRQVNLASQTSSNLESQCFTFRLCKEPIRLDENKPSSIHASQQQGGCLVVREGVLELLSKELL